MTGAGRFALALGFALALAGAALALRPPPASQRETFYLFGTLVEVEIRGMGEGPARAALARVAAHLQALHRDWHAWRPGALSRLNAAIAAGEPQAVSAELAQVLREGRALSCASGGLFEPAIGAAVAAWGFHADTPPDGAPPGAQEIEALLAGHPRIADLMIEPGETGKAGERGEAGVVRSTNRAVRLDLGAYAKGAALDLAMADLRAAGVEHAVLNAGGGVQVMGGHGARPWRVALRDPFQWGVVAALTLAPGEALHSSGNYERYFEAGGVRFSHILDPRTARPVQGIVSVSVLAETGVLADAASTALTVAGREHWPEVAAAMGVRAVLMITDTGEMLASPEMAARLEPPAGGFPAPLTVVALPPAPQPAPACAPP